ncbi:S24 family peptidase [Candidatus Pacearchaeota archaeon]|nr:S24 family peptidase [Candidatus Pacearchaeota archaeon]
MQRAIDELGDKGETYLKVHGNSMLPIIKSGSIIFLIKQDFYKKGDIVLCKVHGNTYVHKIHETSNYKGYLIGNNKGYINGWTNNIYGKFQ